MNTKPEVHHMWDQLFNCEVIHSIDIITHLKMCLADAMHNFKWVKIISDLTK